jgi:hypothetical protein
VTVLYKPHVISMPLESGDNRPEHTVHKPLILFCQCSYQFGVQLWAAHTTPSLLLLDGGGGACSFPAAPVYSQRSSEALLQMQVTWADGTGVHRAAFYLGVCGEGSKKRNPKIQVQFLLQLLLPTSP